MDAFKAQFERIKQQLSALTATQKMLVAALVAVMVLTMLYWGKYAGNAEMVSVLGNQVLTEDEIGPIDRQLTLSGVPHTVDSTGKVMVPADRQTEILADLMFAEALPQDTHSAFETMSKQLNPFSMSSEREASYNRATEMELSQIIGHWKGVASAKVLINAKNDRHIEGTIPPSATVDIRTRGSVEDPKQLVRAAADGVAHAVSGLAASEISVIIDGVSRRVPGATADGLGTSDDLLEAREKCENHLVQAIHEVFPINGLTVNVNCDIDSTTTNEESVKYVPKAQVLSMPGESTEKTDETSNQPAAPREPGVGSNTGANGSISVDASGGGSGGGDISSTSTDETTNKYQNFVGNTVTRKMLPAGKDTAQSATVRVPMSYFPAAYKMDHPSAKDPTDAEMQKFTTQKLAAIRDGVKTIVNLTSDAQLSVDTYEDFPTELAMATGPSVPVATLNTVGGHAKEIALGVLAVVSLFLMASMVRKSTPSTIMMPQFAGAGGAISVGADGMAGGGGGDGVAEVGSGSAALDGMELNDDDVRTQQMLDQVSTMVKENPDSAAALVKRWLSRP
jgi:flagellar biosynthesis/type III secretory pathway M-ring protein FliF/YscJ